MGGSMNWTTIVHGDDSTLPSEYIPYIVKIQDTNRVYDDIWTFETDNEYCKTHWYQSVIAWMPIPEYKQIPLKEE
jgi:hypothetical protein